MTRVVRRADSPVLGHSPRPSRSSTTDWINGCCTCGGFGRLMDSSAPDFSNRNGSLPISEKCSRPSVPLIVNASSFSALAKFHAAVPGTPPARKLIATISSTAQFPPRVIGRQPSHVAQRAKEEIQQIQCVRTDIQKMAAAGLFRPYPPTCVIPMPWRRAKISYARDFPEFTFGDQLLRRQKSRHPPPIVRHKQRQPRFLKRLHHPVTFSGMPRHRLLHIPLVCLLPLPAAHSPRANPAAWRYTCIHLFIRQQSLRPVIRTRHAMTFGIVGRQRAIAPHHRYQRRAFRLLKSRPALHFRHLTAADHSPTDDAPSLEMSGKVHPAWFTREP